MISWENGKQVPGLGRTRYAVSTEGRPQAALAAARCFGALVGITGAWPRSADAAAGAGPSPEGTWPSPGILAGLERGVSLRLRGSAGVFQNCGAQDSHCVGQCAGAGLYRLVRTKC